MEGTMTRRIRRLLAGAFVAAFVLLMATVTSSPASAEDICQRNSPHDGADIRGYTWTGTVTKVETIPFEEVSHETIITFLVDRVYADAHKLDFPADQILAHDEPFRLASLCNGPIGLEVGARYLASTSMLTQDGSSTNLFAAWHLTEVGNASLVDMYEKGLVWPPLKAATTLFRALALAAPDAAPPTDAINSAAHQLGDNSVLVIIAFVGNLTILPLWFRRSRLPDFHPTGGDSGGAVFLPTTSSSTTTTLLGTHVDSFPDGFQRDHSLGLRQRRVSAGWR
jgi:hypothetical protein